MLGRAFHPEEGTQGNNRVLVISHSLWQRRFGGDPGIVGRNVDVQGVSVRIVGVMPPAFAFPTRQTEVWMPLVIQPTGQSRNAHSLRAVARLKPGVSVQQAQSEMDAIASGLRQKYPENYPAGSGFTPRVYSLRDYLVGSVRTPLLVLLGAVAFVLLIACANVANLVLARASTRERELAIRAALGAARGRLVRQALTESVLLATLGGALAILLAYLGLQALIASGPGSIPRLSEVRIDGAVLAFTLAMSLLTGLLVGTAAAFRAGRSDVNHALKEGGRSSAAAGGNPVRRMLVISEVALAAMLLIGAGLLIRGFWKLQQVNTGFQPSGVLSGTVALLHAQYQDEQRQVQFFEQLLAQLTAQPNVQSAAAIDNEPFSGWLNDQSFAIEGRALSAPGLYPDEEFRITTPGYFRTLGIPLLQGRDFESMDHAKSVPVAVISESLARKHWPSENPIGKRIRFGNPTQGPWITIVGIVGDVRHNGLNNEIRPILYFPLAQQPNQGMTILVRATGEPAALAPVLRRAVRELDAGQPIYHLGTMDAAIADSLAQPRFSFQMMAVFAFLALALAAVGIYGVLAYSVSQRTNEIGIRLALGATRWDVMGMVFGSGLRLVCSGLILGVIGGVAVSRVLSTLLFGLSPFDPVAYVSVGVFMLGVASLAVFVPTRRAMNVDPMVALRYE
jgi:putative ABC transport system permease protein